MITRAVVGCATLDFDLATLIAEIKRILNNCSITDVSSDPTDFSALTPNMLLTGSLDDGMPLGIFLNKECYRNS